MFLEWCVDVVGNNAYIIENHFRYARISCSSVPRLSPIVQGDERVIHLAMIAQ
jgi:hypothetical protein